MKGIRWLGPLMLTLLLVGCGATTTTAKTPASAPTPTATTAPTATPTTTPVQTPSASQLAACGFRAGATSAWVIGDVLVTGPNFFEFQSRQLPDNTPLAPFHVALPAGDGFSAVTAPAADPVVNPALDLSAGYGYMFDVCNSSSTKTHILKGVGVRIKSATAYSGQLNAWNLCDGGIYDASTKQTDGGCGGGICGFNETLKAMFNTATAGANATVTQMGWHSGGCLGPVDGPLPVSLKPHSSISLNMGIALPPSQATYTFAFGVAQDSLATVFLPATDPVLLAPVAHKWTGEACASSAMQSQIPSASSPTYYICPAS